MSYLDRFPQTQSTVFSTSPDCYISKTVDGRYFASSIDFFYPLVDDSFTQGQITACNVLSDLYAAGITNVDSFLVILGLSTKLTQENRKSVAIELMAGMEDKIREAGTKIVGGQTVFNPWVTVGGSVLGFFDKPEHVIQNRHCEVGDVLILTKPIGTQLSVNFDQYFRKDLEKRNILETAGLKAEELEQMSLKVRKSMSTLNLNAAKVMNSLHESVKACTDITGFGLKGHCENLSEIQIAKVNFKIERFPVFKGFKKYDKLVRDFKLKDGLAAETSGGLLIVMKKESAQTFLNRLKQDYGQESWIIGEVVKGNGKTVIGEDVQLFEV